MATSPAEVRIAAAELADAAHDDRYHSQSLIDWWDQARVARVGNDGDLANLRRLEHGVHFIGPVRGRCRSHGQRACPS